jgi:hypothetical protein
MRQLVCHENPVQHTTWTALRSPPNRFRTRMLQVRVELLLKGAPTRRRHSGMAVVHLATAADATRGCQALDGKPVLGRPMIVRKDRWAQADRGDSSGGGVC